MQHKIDVMSYYALEIEKGKFRNISGLNPIYRPPGEIYYGGGMLVLTSKCLIGYPFIVYFDQTNCESLFHLVGGDIAMAILGQIEEGDFSFPQVRLQVGW